MFNLQIKTKLILALSTIMVVAFVVTSVFNYRLSREAIRKEIITSSLPLTSENIYSQIHTDLLRPINVSSLMANDTFLRDWVKNHESSLDQIEDYLSSIQRRYGYFASFFVSALSGNYYHADGVLKKIHPSDEHDDWFYDFVRSGKEYILDVDTNEAQDNNLTIFINYRLEDSEGNLLGVTGVGLEMDRIATLLKKYQRTYDRIIYLVDRDGLIQAHMKKTLISSESITDWQELDSHLKAILTPQSNSQQFEFDRDGKHVLMSVRYIPEFDWFLVVEQDERLALATARANLIRTLLIGLGASIFIIFVTILSTNHYQRRLESMAATDELTGVPNRKEFGAQFERATHRYERTGRAFSLLLLDIDNLKEVNDTKGHLDGDKVIIAVSGIILQAIRKVDVVARWGGDEFIVLVEGDARQATAVAERIRGQVEQAGLPYGKNESWDSLPVSVSCGVCEYVDGDSLDAMTMRADQAMYEAKKDGKNAVRTV